MWRTSTSSPREWPETAASASATIERIASRDRLIVLAALLAAAGLSWLWLARAPMPGATNVWTAAYLFSAVGMWALMMVAMMLPSAGRTILLYARFARRAAPAGALAGTMLCALAYLAVWLLFSLAAAIAQAWLVSSGAMSAMALAVGDRRLAGAILLLAGLYELTPLKRACLSQCQSPVAFIVRLWRPGAAGALRLGLVHGLYCLGCCWALMGLLFVGGVMSLGWIGALALLVLAEKLAPPSIPLREASGVALIVAGVLALAG